MRLEPYKSPLGSPALMNSFMEASLPWSGARTRTERAACDSEQLSNFPTSRYPDAHFLLLGIWGTTDKPRSGSLALDRPSGFAYPFAAGGGVVAGTGVVVFDGVTPEPLPGSAVGSATRR